MINMPQAAGVAKSYSESETETETEQVPVVPDPDPAKRKKAFNPEQLAAARAKAQESLRKKGELARAAKEAEKVLIEHRRATKQKTIDAAKEVVKTVQAEDAKTSASTNARELPSDLKAYIRRKTEKYVSQQIASAVPTFKPREPTSMHDEVYAAARNRMHNKMHEELANMGYEAIFNGR